MMNNNKTPQFKQDIDDFISSKLFKVLNEEVRLQIIRYLVLNGPADITTIASHFPQDRSVISRHLKLMAEYGVLSCHKESRRTVYSFECITFYNQMETTTQALKNLITKNCPEHKQLLDRDCKND